MVHFYRPNKNITGFAASFWYSEKNDAVFATILKQSGWDDVNQNGIFKNSINDPNKKVNIKLDYVEVSAILDCIERNRPFNSFHDHKDNPKSINFIPWMDKTNDKQKGYSFSVTVTDKNDSSVKNPFYIGLTFSEARLIREFLIFILHKHFNQLKFNPTNHEVINEPVKDPLLGF